WADKKMCRAKTTRPYGEIRSVSYGNGTTCERRDHCAKLEQCNGTALVAAAECKAHFVPSLIEPSEWRLQLALGHSHMLHRADYGANNGANGKGASMLG